MYALVIKFKVTSILGVTLTQEKFVCIVESKQTGEIIRHALRGDDGRIVIRNLTPRKYTTNEVHPTVAVKNVNNVKKGSS